MDSSQRTIRTNQLNGVRITRASRVRCPVVMGANKYSNPHLVESLSSQEYPVRRCGAKVAVRAARRVPVQCRCYHGFVRGQVAAIATVVNQHGLLIAMLMIIRADRTSYTLYTQRLWLPIWHCNRHDYSGSYTDYGAPAATVLVLQFSP